MLRLRIIILTEGGKRRGLGHLTRCLSVAQAFAVRGIVPTAVCRGELKPVALKEFRGTAWVETWDWVKDTVRLAKKIEGTDIVFIDSYEAPRSAYLDIARSVPLGVYFDDARRLPYPRGIVINGAAGAEGLRYADAAGVRHLLGCRYFPVRKAFWTSPARIIRRDIRTILVMLGGSDSGSLAPRLLNFLGTSRPRSKKVVVIGPGFGRVDDLKNAADDRTTFLETPNAPALRKAMRAADVAISAAGQTLYELARTGTPTVAILVDANQRLNAKGLAKAGFIEYAGPGTARHMSGRVERALGILDDAGVRRHRSRIGQTLVPGDGALKIVDAILKSYVTSRFTLRRFEGRDARGIFLLSNQADIRKNSFRQGAIRWADHQTWFHKKLTDKNSLCLVAEITGILLGQVRFEMLRDRAWVSISRDFRGYGLGKDMLTRSINFLREAFPGVRTVIAQIRKENLASIRFFENCGFEYGGETSIVGQAAVEYILPIQGGLLE
jgi:spore coat polysaccharide biosynthesis predicted glycosyltransferase SpsG/RimJ/RimL family protein N-acetyltransferase